MKNAFKSYSYCPPVVDAVTCHGDDDDDKDLAHMLTQWRNYMYVRRGEAAASGRRAAGGATEFNQNNL